MAGREDPTQLDPPPRAETVAPARGPQPRLEAGATVAGCVVERALGRGGMGIVLAARDPRGQPVALKVMLHVERAGSRFERFKREVEAARAFDHPNIVKVLGADLEGPFGPCIVMELVLGPTLDQVLADPRRSVPEKLDLVEQVCRAVHHAHERGILHRDLKPSNVLVDALGRAKVTDFGLARDVSRQTRLTETGAVIGTPSYLAPEVVRGEAEAGVSNDVWALGVILYEALAGRPPFDGASPVELVRRILDQAPPPPSSLDPRCGPAHDRVAARALAKDPRRRHPTALALAQDLRALRQRRRVPGRRGPGLALASTLLVGLLVAAAIMLRPSPAPPPPPSPPASPSPSSSLVAARAAISSFDGERALAAADEALALAPGSLEALSLRGRAHDLLLRTAEAERDLEAVAAGGDPALAYDALLLLATLARAREDLGGASARYTEATRAAPDRFEAWTRRGLLALLAGQKDSSPCRSDLAIARRLVDLQGTPPGASEALRALAALTWDDAHELPRADRRRAEGLDQAERLLARALEVEPGDAEAYALRARVHRDRGDAERERADLARSLELYEQAPDLASRFARLARERRRRLQAADSSALLPAARGAALRACAGNERHPLGLQELAICGAIAAVVQLIRGDDAALGEARLRQAIQALDDALQVNSGLLDARLHRGQAWVTPWSGRDLARGRLDLDAVLAAAPDHAVALAYRALARLAQGEAREALADAERALALDPGLDAALLARDEARRALGR